MLIVRNRHDIISAVLVGVKMGAAYRIMILLAAKHYSYSSGNSE
jgi:hypothetical protein